MFGRAIIGAVAAAVVLFVLGFIFYGTPLHHLAIKSLPDPQAASIQTVLAQNMPETGTYSVPSGRTADQTTLYGRGPIATIHYNLSGYPIGNAGVMVKGFIHLLVVGLLMATGLYILSRHVPLFGERARLLCLGVVGAMAYVHFRDPIWFHHDWTYAIYAFVADTISLGAAGLVILKLLPDMSRLAPAQAPTDV